MGAGLLRVRDYVGEGAVEIEGDHGAVGAGQDGGETFAVEAGVVGVGRSCSGLLPMGRAYRGCRSAATAAPAAGLFPAPPLSETRGSAPASRSSDTEGQALPGQRPGYRLPRRASRTRRSRLTVTGSSSSARRSSSNAFSSW